jgi:hypothetical protein
MRQLWFGKKKIWMFVTVSALFFTSCVEGYKDDWNFSAGVENVELQSPDAEKVTITKSADGTKLTVSWPVVFGAGGYQFSLYIVDDPANPVAVGQENETVDGCYAEREMQEDTRYKVVIKTLGNPKYNNREAATATEIAYNNMLPVTAVIPNGANLTDYFAANPIPASDTELCYELEAGGSYTMNGNVPTKLTSVTFRGDKTNHAKLTMTGGAFLNDGAGLVLKFLDIDCSAFDGTAVILLNATFNPAAEAAMSAGGYVVIPTTSPIAVQSCRITGLYQRLFYDNNKKYAIGTFLIKDCVIGQDVASSVQLIRSQQTVFKDLTLTNSTFYNERINGGYFIQIQAGQVTAVRPDAETWANANLTITNSTFWQIVKTDQMGNYANNFAQRGNNITIRSCIFVDCGNKAVIRRFGGGNANATLTCGFNSYWYDGAFVAAELTTTPKDASGTHFETDPQLRNPAGGDFTPQGAAQIAARTGDPRWLPNITE